MFTEDKLPCIIFWEFNHFLVLEGFKNGRAFLSNPALGRHSVSEEDFKTSYSGVALILKPGPNFEKGGTPEKSIYQQILGIPKEQVKGEIDVWNPHHLMNLQMMFERNARRTSIEQNAT